MLLISIENNCMNHKKAILILHVHNKIINHTSLVVFPYNEFLGTVYSHHTWKQYYLAFQKEKKTQKVYPPNTSKYHCCHQSMKYNIAYILFNRYALKFPIIHLHNMRTVVGNSTFSWNQVVS